MADCRPGPKPEFTNRLHVQMRPEQRESLDYISARVEVSVSGLVRWFIDEGIARAERAFEVIEASSPEEVVAALLSIGYQQSEIDQVLANQKEKVNGKAEPVSQEHG